MAKIAGLLAAILLVCCFVEFLKEKRLNGVSLRQKIVYGALAKFVEVMWIAVLASILLKVIFGPPGFSILLEGK
jgi:hypothetical protein